MARYLTWAVAAACAATIGSAAEAQSEDSLPLYELGIFGLGGYTSDYPGSNQSHFHALPLPYVVYRGKYFRMNGNTAAGIVYDSPDVTFDVSFSGAFDTSSKSDIARRGMPSLGYLGEIGPRLNVTLLRQSPEAWVDLELPVRAALSTDFSSLGYRGWTFAPKLAYQYENFLAPGGRFKIGIGPKFATGELMDYFYQVPPQYRAPGRPPYNAKAGYLGSSIEAQVKYPVLDRVTFLSIVSGSYYKGATNESSPLFKKTTGYSVILGLSYSLYRSDEPATGKAE